VQQSRRRVVPRKALVSCLGSLALCRHFSRF
jgi:hypothetical protein